MMCKIIYIDKVFNIVPLNSCRINCGWSCTGEIGGAREYTKTIGVILVRVAHVDDQLINK